MKTNKEEREMDERDIVMYTLFCLAYGYKGPTLGSLMIDMKNAGIGDPIAAMEVWRKEKDLLTDMELSSGGEE